MKKEQKIEKPKDEKSKSFSQEKNGENPVKVLKEEELPTSTVIVPVTTFSRPIVSVKEAQEAFEQYQQLINALIKQKDVVKIKDKIVAKKVGINKLARFFGISVEIIKEKQETYIGPKGGTILIAKVWAKAILPSGAFRVAGGACSSSERRFNHLYADVFATAETRSVKRAVEGLIGFGELELIDDIKNSKDEISSYEEAEEENSNTENPPKEPTKQGEEAITTEQIATIQELAGDNLPKLRQFIEEKYGAKTWLDLTRKQGIALLKGLRNKKYEKSPENLPKDAGEMVGEENTGQ